ncbi:hypothetical protein CEXT_507751 [Caerostris extrusa]|uniref:Uncharacterized protein n=1 Tax=Caerostris extrusa TaxID=172846 RepID=A0AAV4XC25_CAEEX|nr:hypothetical protein CEXT_507751 [Caerostris extrusa]
MRNTFKTGDKGAKNNTHFQIPAREKRVRSSFSTASILHLRRYPLVDTSAVRIRESAPRERVGEAIWTTPCPSPPFSLEKNGISFRRNFQFRLPFCVRG